MKKAGILSSEETTQLIEAYHFLRRLTNSLRMLRGSAEDLFLPDVTSDEYTHLARRAGYTWKGGYSPAQILHLEFETRTAAIRKFVEQHLGRESLPGPPVGNAADLILSESLSEKLVKSILEEAGFKNLTRAKENLAILADGKERRRLFAQLAVLAWDILKQTPDSDMALNNWERFASSVPDIRNHLKDLLSQPKRLEIILGIFSGSQFLADTLIRYPEFFDWVSAPAIINKVRTTNEMAADLERVSAYYEEHEEWLKGLRRFRLKEILRIGTRDICLRVPERDIIEELSNLAESILRTALKRTEDAFLTDEEKEVYRFCILAFGKLGGKELNYSSDIDLIGVYDPLPLPEYNGETVKNKCSRIMEQLRSDLSTYSDEGYVYRVDLRLRPFGRSGDIVSSLETLLHYYTHQAALWEIQALLKLRPIAGEIATGNRFLEQIKPLLLKKRDPEEVFGSIITMREQSQKRKQFGLSSGMDVKNGEGGIRDIEFLVQGLQLVYLYQHPTLFSENTLTGISLLRQAGILTPETADRLSDDYLFLRRVEHFLQIYEDRQIHTLPENETEKRALAKRLLGGNSSSEQFFLRLEEIKTRVVTLYSSIVN
jgi:glutamate-ammonia-ligase adenylyltransferase